MGAEDAELTPWSLLEGAATRTRLVDDLEELKGFWSQTVAELAGGGGAAAGALPLEVQPDASEAAARLAAVDAPLAALEAEHTKHLLLLGASDAYVERQARSLEQMLDSADKMRARADELHTRHSELELTIAATARDAAALVDAVRAAKGQLEAAISKHFDGRRVNIMGEINALL